MTVRHALRKFFAPASRRQTTIRKQPRQPRARLHLDILEDRTVPATFTVYNGDMFSLIGGINYANRDTQADTIVLTGTLYGTLTWNVKAVNNTVSGPNGLPAITTPYGL